MSVHFEEIRLTLPHIELAAHIYGPERGIPVLALHGWLDNAASFTRLAPKLTGARIVALDLAGHGHSGHRPAGCHYSLWDYAYDVLQVAEQLGWQRFTLMGHSLGAIISTLFASAMPERVERLALIDGLLPSTTAPEDAPAKLAEALKGQLLMDERSKPVYLAIEDAVGMRMMGVGGRVSREAAELLVQRGMMPVPGGYTWRADSRLRLASPLRLDDAQARAFLLNLSVPVDLVIAERGILQGNAGLSLLQTLTNVHCHHLPGGHHLHLDDEVGARRVADCFKHLIATP